MRSLWTLTYRVARESRSQVIGDVRGFFERCRRTFGRQALVAVIERGTENGRLHIHFAASAYLPRRRIERVWGLGWVHVRGARPGRRGWAVKHLARYLAKYLAKDVDEGGEGDPRERAEGKHRYLLTQGFTPTAWTWRFRHPDHAAAMAELLMGAPSTVIAFGEDPDSLVCGWWIDWPDPLE